MQKKIFNIVVILLSFAHASASIYAQQPVPSEQVVEKEYIIRNIIVEGNNLVTKGAILARIPFQSGDRFVSSKTGDLIRNVYALQYFNKVSLELEKFSDYEVDLYIIVEEKKKVEEVIFKGNSAISDEDIEKELKLSEIPAMDEEELGAIASKIKRLYAGKNYHTTSIETQLEPTDQGTYRAIFCITEGPVAVVRRVYFEGNECVASRDLRKMIFTREDWLFGFLTKAGSYQPDMLNVDQYMIENFYQSNGFLAARVVDINVDIDESTQDITVTYYIDEGPVFFVKSVSAPGNELRTEDELLRVLPVAPGQLYSRDTIRRSIEALRNIWGSYGYIYADIEPVIIPNFEERTVDITFNSELSRKMYLNRITITGNEKTCDYVIRREIGLTEGELLSLPAMERAKAKVQALGFFDPQGGVDWKINKIAEDTVDLDLVVSEAKTGRLGGQIGYGGADPQSPSTSVRIGGYINERNLLGTGIEANLNLQWSKRDRLVILNFYKPWLFDRPIGGGLGFVHRHSFYEDIENVTMTPREQETIGEGRMSFLLPGYPDVSTSVTAGIQRIQFQEGIRAAQIANESRRLLYQTFIDRRFESGTQAIVGVVLGQDVRNHPVFPNRGYNWTLATKVGVPATTFGFAKADFDATWLTPLIGEYDLVFVLHGHAGIVGSLNNKIIPYRELYNIGGPGSVRGFEFGQIGPQFVAGTRQPFGSSIGAKKAFWVNAELMFSVTQDQSIRGLVFYDGGAGWDTPLTQEQQDLLLLDDNRFTLRNNQFRYRHAIGFGIRLLNPAPIRIDWGFKLDRNRRRGEKFYEVHFQMDQQF